MHKTASLINCRDDFPILTQRINDKPMVYLDNGATSQKPKVVIDTINQYYQQQNANVHRGVYTLSERATAAYESGRAKVQKFIHAPSVAEIIFTRGATEAINLVAYCFAEQCLQPGDEVIISHMEHHSNIVPWQIACQRKQATLKVIPVLDDGELDLSALPELITPHTKLIAITHVSNVLGTVNPIKEIVATAHKHNVAVLVDGAQATPHMAVDVQDLNCDFYVFSAHKMYGPMGVGVLYGKQKWLAQFPPYQSGGEMISQVYLDHSEYNVLPHKFEAGTPNVAGVIGLGAAIDYLQALGYANISRYEQELLSYATNALQNIPGLNIIGTCADKAAVISFTLDAAHPHDIATILDFAGIAVRAGHHCAMPLMERFAVPATARVSLGVYNNHDDIDKLVKGLQTVNEMFGGK